MKYLLAKYFFPYLWIFLTCIQTLNGFDNDDPAIVMIARQNRNCTFDHIANIPGWKCADGQCFPLKWICDRFSQCPGDNWDENDGCNLFPNTGCKSWNAKKHVKCPHNNKCVEDLEDCPKDLPTDPVDPTEDTSCPVEDGNEQWRCTDGRCIHKNMVCDGSTNCEDSSDEKQGCELFANTGCKSWNGMKYVKCQNNNTEMSDVCTLPEKQYDECRNCTILKSNKEINGWRCTDGRCIELSKRGDGLPDCLDNSDETALSTKWYWLLLAVLGFAGVAVFISIGIRQFYEKMGTFTFCGSSRSKEICNKNPMTTIRRRREQSPPYERGDTMDEADANVIGLTEKPDYNKEVSVLTDEEQNRIKSEVCKLPLKLIHLLEDPDAWRKRSLIKGYRRKTGQQDYARVHQDPEQFRNLYMYLVSRYALPDRLKRATVQLSEWEEEMHENDSQEIQKCLRLHLGSSEILKIVLQSIQEKRQSEDNPFTKTYHVWKSKARNWRERHAPECLRKIGQFIARANRASKFAVRPFLGAMALYFDIFKDCTFAILIYTSWKDHCEGKNVEEANQNCLTNSEYSFESALIVILIFVIALVQVLFMFLTNVTFPKMFDFINVLNISPIWKKILVACTSIIVGPFGPIIALANYFFYKDKEQFYKRELQSQGCVEFDVKDEPDTELQILQDKEKLSDPDDDFEKVSLFRKIKITRYKAALHRKFYSHYRVVQASIESFVVLQILLLILLISQRPGRSSQIFWKSVSSRISEFFDLHRRSAQDTDASHLHHLGLVNDTVFALAIAYSVIMIMTALARYVFQCKNGNMNIRGQICYGIYILCHLITRSCMAIAMFSTAESSGRSEEAPVSSTSAAILSLFFAIATFVIIFIFKYCFIKEFRKARIQDQLVHVLANTLVVIPFMSWDQKKPDSNESVEADDILCDTTEEMLSKAKKVQEKKSLEIASAKLKKQKSEEDLHKKQSKKMGHKRAKSEFATGSYKMITPTTSPEKKNLENNMVPDSVLFSMPILLPIIPKRLKDEVDKFQLGSTEKLTAELIIEKMNQQNKGILVENKEHVHRVIEIYHEEQHRMKLKQAITKLWWNNPKNDLTTDSIKTELIKNGHHDLVQHEQDVIEVFKKLNEENYINKRELFYPRRTKFEYFWMFFLTLLINFGAFIVELINGHSKTGMNYYSWDIRICSFLIGLIFLAVYYSRYHVQHSLTRFHICGGCWFHICPIICGRKNEKDMDAAPNVNDIEQILSNPPTPPRTKTIGLDTQISLVQCKIEDTSETNSVTDKTLLERSRKSSVDVGTDTVDLGIGTQTNFDNDIKEENNLDEKSTTESFLEKIAKKRKKLSKTSVGSNSNPPSRNSVACSPPTPISRNSIDNETANLLEDDIEKNGEKFRERQSSVSPPLDKRGAYGYLDL